MFLRTLQIEVAAVMLLRLC